MRPILTALAALLCAGLATPALADTPAAAPAEASATPASPATSAADDGVPDLPAGTIYLLTRIQLNGTDMEQVDFFTEKTITTLDDCERQRTVGMTEGWQAYHHYLQTYKGMSYKVEYRCVVSDQRLSQFRYGQRPDNFYLVRTDADSRVHLEHFRNFFACRNALYAHGMHEAVENFCARTAQSLVDN